MNHASGEEAVGAVFTDGQTMGKAKRGEQDEGPSSRQEKKKKKKRDLHHPNPNTSQRLTEQASDKATTTISSSSWRSGAPTTATPSSTSSRIASSSSRYLVSPASARAGDRDKEVPKEQGAPAKDGNTFSDPNGCLMIFEGPEDDCTKRQHPRPGLRNQDSSRPVVAGLASCWI
jgi:hypothetical protein